MDYSSQSQTYLCNQFKLAAEQATLLLIGSLKQNTESPVFNLNSSFVNNVDTYGLQIKHARGEIPVQL